MTARAAGWALALCVMSYAACGHYGPPVRSEPAREKATAAPAAPGAPEPAKDEEQKPRD